MNIYLIVSHSPCMSHKRSHEFITWWILELLITVCSVPCQKLWDLHSTSIWKKGFFFVCVCVLLVPLEQILPIDSVVSWHVCCLAGSVNFVKTAFSFHRNIPNYKGNNPVQLIMFGSTNNIASKSTKITPN